MKPLLLLIPGMLNTPRIWQRVLPLVGEAAEVRIADVQSQASIADMARDAWARVADAPAGRPLALCGFSMGGYVAIQMLSAPARAVQALGLLDTSGRPETPDGAANREKAIAGIERDFEKAIAGTAKFGTAPGTQADAQRMDEILGVMRDTGGATAIRQHRAIMARGDHRAMLAQLAIPTLVMCGRSDQITPPALSEELAATIPGARLEWIDDAGHMTPLEQPERVAQLLRSLLAMAGAA